MQPAFLLTQDNRARNIVLSQNAHAIKEEEKGLAKAVTQLNDNLDNSEALKKCEAAQKALSESKIRQKFLIGQHYVGRKILV